MQMNFVFKGILCEKTILTTLRDVFKMVPICNFLEGKGGIDIENIISTSVSKMVYLSIGVVWFYETMIFKTYSYLYVMYYLGT